MNNDQDFSKYIGRIADALERLAPALPAAPNLKDSDAFVWNADHNQLKPATNINLVHLALLKGISRTRDTLLNNTLRFAKELPANNALLWGARGMGKSSLVKAVHARINQDTPNALALIEIHREDISSLPLLLDQLRLHDRRFLLFCDDLSFDQGNSEYKSLKAVLEGGIEGRPENVIFYATSNRRHMMPRDIIENDQSNEINPSDAVDEKVSLSDRFGLWLGFHACDQTTYLDMIQGYVEHYHLNIDAQTLRAEAIEWSVTRGGRSGRVAWQYIQDLAGRLGKKLIT
ncbi:MAG TPA: ATP-binding protein [Alphaproteobacteria bacterium]|nr:ATP-binding protein [Alphaproteobacteria bacterium]HIM71790.1 ATP-binding protein [Alphaproteobacteria bacterium]